MVTVMTEKQYNALVHILDKTHMGCWACPMQSNVNGVLYDYIYDVEEDEALNLKDAFEQLVDGFVDLESLGISAEEIECINELVHELGIDYTYIQ